MLKCIQEIIGLEKELETFKIALAKCEDFNLIDAFGMLDEAGRGFVTPSELHDALIEL